MDWMSEDFYPTDMLIEALTLLRTMQLKSDGDYLVFNVSDERFKELAKYEIVKQLRKAGFKRKLPKVKKFQWTEEERKKPENVGVGIAEGGTPCKTEKAKERVEDLKKKLKKPRQIIIDNVDEEFFDRLRDWLGEKEEKELDVKGSTYH